jgi:hypothetical protein
MKLLRSDTDLKYRSINSYRGLTGVTFNNTDFLKQLDPNIADAVMILNSKGYVSVGSCHGHSIIEYLFTDRQNFVLTGPYIQIQANSTQIDYLLKTFDTLLTVAKIEDNTTIWIEARFLFRLFLTNKYLSNKITEICKKIEII